MHPSGRVPGPYRDRCGAVCALDVLAAMSSTGDAPRACGGRSNVSHASIDRPDWQCVNCTAWGDAGERRRPYPQNGPRAGLRNAGHVCNACYFSLRAKDPSVKRVRLAEIVCATPCAARVGFGVHLRWYGAVPPLTSLRHPCATVTAVRRVPTWPAPARKAEQVQGRRSVLCGASIARSARDA